MNILNVSLKTVSSLFSHSILEFSVEWHVLPNFRSFRKLLQVMPVPFALVSKVPEFLAVE